MQLEILTVVSADHVADPLSRSVETAIDLPTFRNEASAGRAGRKTGRLVSLSEDTDIAKSG
jgi:hypothetical protein